MKKKSSQKKRKTGRHNQISVLILKIIAVLVLLLLFLFICVYIGIFGRIPNQQQLGKIQNHTASEIYSDDGKLLGRYYIQNRTNVSYEEIPDFFIKALIATEDVRFMKHKGIDRRSMARVVFKSILLFNESSGGGSTITQQLAKNLYPRKNYWIFTTPVGKFKEMIIASRLEKVYSKKDILELYMNTVSFGENTYGIETAALRFFNKRPGILKMEESAMLVGMLKGTNLYNPKRDYDKALARRNVVFQQMVKYNMLTANVADSLQNLPIKLNYVRFSHNQGPAPYFREYLRLELLEILKKYNKEQGTNYNIYTDGLKIYTTLNYDLQYYAEQAVKEQLIRLQELFDRHWKNREPWNKNYSLINNEIKRSDRYKSFQKQGLEDEEILKKMEIPVSMEIFNWSGTREQKMSPLDSIKHYFKFLQAGVLSMEAKTGFIRVWVGGINYKYFQYDHVISKRQPGSVFKPIIYAAAIENGISPCDYYANDSVVYEDYNNWIPRNADREYGGYYTLKGGLTQSVNTVSVHLLMDTGFDKVIKLAKKMGITSDLPEVPSLALGTGECSLYDLVKVYSVFANRGTLMKPVYLRKVEDKSGNVLYTDQSEIEEPEVISSETAELMIALLQNVVNSGTASGLRSVYGFNNDIAGKTGTTQKHTDGWFIGFTPDLVTGVWVGGDNPAVRFRSLSLGQGSATALPVWGRFMGKIYRDPLYRNSKNATFNLSGELINRLDCPDFSEEPYETLDEYLRREDRSIIEIIKHVFRKKSKKNKSMDGDDSDNSE
ncbi:MAG: transglycosylase domain-containing protein [Bacteroidales bacterium]|nr:transglycosylase domain-containing protein [Bacteroidales bacterium]